MGILKETIVSSKTLVRISIEGVSELDISKYNTSEWGEHLHSRVNDVKKLIYDKIIVAPDSDTKDKLEDILGGNFESAFLMVVDYQNFYDACSRIQRSTDHKTVPYSFEYLKEDHGRRFNTKKVDNKNKLSLLGFD
jgi:hypothetical protein